jgi:hypothetical protein
MKSFVAFAVIYSGFAIGCSSTSSPSPSSGGSSGGGVDASIVDATLPRIDAGADVQAIDVIASDAGASDSSVIDATSDVDKSATCATTFGSALTNAFGRLDGTLLAVIPPNDQNCAMPNSTHLVIQVTMGGAAYRMVVDVLSDQGNPDVFFYEFDAPLAGGAWADGWHTTATLDYATTLNLHSASFAEMNEATVVAKLTSELSLGSHISIFATDQDETSSAHLIHRNTTNADGAIVINPEAATPHYMLIRFDEQDF